MDYEIIDHYFNIFFEEIQLKRENLKNDFWAPKLLYWSPKQPEYVTAESKEWCMQLLRKTNLTQIACYCKLILQQNIVANIKMKFSLPCGHVDLWIFLQLLSTMQREKKSLFSLLPTRLIKRKTVFVLSCLNLLMKWL